MTQDLITRNLQDQINNFGQETIVANTQGERRFVDPRTGAVVARSVNAARYDLQNSPLDNSFQLNPSSYAVSKALFEQPGVPENLSDTYGAIVAVTAKDLGVGANQLFAGNVMAPALLENVNFFRSAHSKVGINSNAPAAPYRNNLMLGAKIANQTG